MATGTLFSATLSSNSDGWNGFTGVIRIQASAMSLPSGSIAKLRLRYKAGSSQGFTVTNTYMEHRAGSGDVYDFAATPTQILFAGSASKTVSAGSTEWSDWIDFAYNKTDDLLISFYAGGGTGSDMLSYALSVTGVNKHDKVANDAATVNKTGYGTTAGYCGLIDAIEYETDVAGGNFFPYF